MTQHSRDDLWRDFPRTATELEARFATEADCRAHWIEARWGGKPACARCQSLRVWAIRKGTTFECAECGHQTSLTSGTLLEKTRKPLKMWFRAVFEISTRRTGISAKDPQRITTRRRGPGCTSCGRLWCGLSGSRSALSSPATTATAWANARRVRQPWPSASSSPSATRSWSVSTPSSSASSPSSSASTSAAKSERITDDQLALALDEIETAAAKVEAEAEKGDPARKAAAARKRRASRDERLDHRQHEDVVIESESNTYPYCGGELHVIGEDVSKRSTRCRQRCACWSRGGRSMPAARAKTGADKVAGIIQAAAPSWPESPKARDTGSSISHARRRS